MRIGTWRQFGNSRRAMHVSKPFMPGITTSRTMQSDGCAWKAPMRGRAVGGRSDAKPGHLERRAEQQPRPRIVVDDEHRGRLI